MFTYEGDISNYLGVNIKKHLDGTFKLFQSHLSDKRINHLGHTLSLILKSIETPAVKPFLNKYVSILLNKWVCNYRAAVVLLSYLQGSTCLEISITAHKSAICWNNSRLVHESSVKWITKYPSRTSTYTDLPDGNRQLSTHDLVYRTTE